MTPPPPPPPVSELAAAETPPAVGSIYDSPARSTRGASSGMQLQIQQQRQQMQADKAKERADSLVVKLRVQREKLMEIFLERKKKRQLGE
ncbi:hypothetical protein JX265_009561 [Neoarthrinium moseri]|uniref:Uncharacterized protein n=1 Tax=Neoarthrinium moseri TaxID=1658444 RepID=A0A9P9WG90_9PEZI|nr:hypothetical protein JX265_009561 [Neoarthrinium moseri]